MDNLLYLKYLFVLLGLILSASGLFLIFTKKQIQGSDDFMKVMIFGFFATALLRTFLKTRYNTLKPYEIKSFGIFLLLAGGFCIYSGLMLI